MNLRTVVENKDTLETVLASIIDPLTAHPTKAVVIGFIGNLGAGKTTATQIIGKILGVIATIQSPTFVIEKKYPIDWHGFKTLVHLDVYRLTSDELSTIRFEERLQMGNTLIIVEWADRIPEALPSDAHIITLEQTGENSRILTYTHE